MKAARRSLVLGFCTHYDFAAIEPFLASFLNCGSDARVCLFTHALDERFYQAAARHAVLIEDAGPYLGLGYHAQNARWFAYQEYLRRESQTYDRVLLTDVRDVFFQSDPFAVRHPKAVCFSMEDTRIAWEAINQAWLRDIYGDTVLSAIADNHVACAGTVLGTQVGIETYLDVMCAELRVRSFDRLKVYDQGVHNYIAWSLRPDWVWIDGPDAIVDTVGCTGAERIEVVDDLVVIDGKVPPVVHQWDRHEHLREHVARSPRFRLGR